MENNNNKNTCTFSPIIIAENDFACAKLEPFSSDEIRIVFYDSDNHYINDWVIEGENWSSEFETIINGFKINTDDATITFFYNCEPTREIIEPIYFKDYLKIKKEYSDEYVNRIGSYLFLYKD